MDIVPSADDDETKEANITDQVMNFMKKVSKGVPVTFLNEATNERCRTLYTIDRNMKYLIILSPNSDEGALVVCRLSRIIDIGSVELGEKNLPQSMMDKLTDSEKNLFAVIAYRKEAKGQKLRLCLFSGSVAERNEFVLCLKVLSAYSKALLKSQANTKMGLLSFLSCLPCGAGHQNSIMHGKELVGGVDTEFQIYIPQRLQQLDDDEVEDEHQHRVDSDGRIHVVWRLRDRNIRTSAGLPGGLLPGDAVLSKIDLQGQRGIRLRKGDEGRVVGGSPDSLGINIDFETVGNVNLLPTQIEKKKLGDGYEDLPLQEIVPVCNENISLQEEIVPEYKEFLLDRAISKFVASKGRTAPRSGNQERWSLWRCCHQDAKLFVADGSRMEYFSPTNKRWSIATVRVEETSDIPLRIVYNAILAKDQERKDAMQFLRRLFRKDDLVEVFLNRSDSADQEDLGLAQWYAARITGPPRRMSGTLIGYTVSLDKYDEIFECVSSGRVRQRYPRGDPVYVYRGLDEGWSPGVVDDSSSVDGLGAKCYTPPVRDRPSTLEFGEDNINGKDRRVLRSLSSIKSETSRNIQPQRFRRVGSLTREDSDDSVDCEIDPWVLVPVVLHGTSNYEEFPSYLVRRSVESIE